MLRAGRQGSAPPPRRHGSAGTWQGWQRQAGTAAKVGQPQEPPVPGRRGWVCRIWPCCPGHCPHSRWRDTATAGSAAPSRPAAGGAGTAAPHRSPRVPAGAGGPHPAGGSSLSPSPWHPPPWLMAAPKDIPRSGHGSVPWSPRRGRCHSPPVPSPWQPWGPQWGAESSLLPTEQPHSGATRIAHPATSARGHGRTIWGQEQGWSPVTQQIRPLGSAAARARAGGMRGPRAGGGTHTQSQQCDTKAQGRGGGHLPRGFSTLGRGRAPAAVLGDIGDNLWQPLAPAAGASGRGGTPDGSPKPPPCQRSLGLATPHLGPMRPREQQWGPG